MSVNLCETCKGNGVMRIPGGIMTCKDCDGIGVAHVNGIDKALTALRAIAALGGNLPDSRFEDASGPNDARQRGILLTSSRAIAVRAIIDIGGGIPEILRNARIASDGRILG